MVLVLYVSYISIFHFPKPIAWEFLSSWRDILSWISFIVFCWYQGIWVLDNCNSMCWILVLSFLGGYSAHWFLCSFGSKRVWLAWLSGRECFWDPALCGHGIFQLECVSWYWELTLRDGDMLERKGAEGIHRREKSWLWHLDLFSIITMGTKWQEKPLLVVCYRFGMRLIGRVWRRGRKWRSEGCLPTFLGYPLLWAVWTEASQWRPLGNVSFSMASMVSKILWIPCGSWLLRQRDWLVRGTVYILWKK